MHHIRYPRAAVAVATPGKSANTPTRKLDQHPASAPVVLWASTALYVGSGGRLVGLRRGNNSEDEVAWLRPGSLGIQWVPTSLLLTEQEAKHWRKVALFYRQ